MEIGINMGRRCPWSQEYLRQLYDRLNTYCKVLTVEALMSEDQKAAAETMASYSMFKMPVVYVFMHYHYGKFEDLGMDNKDISAYMFYLSIVKDFTKGILEGLMEEEVFVRDKTKELSPALIEICKEVIFVEENY